MRPLDVLLGHGAIVFALALVAFAAGLFLRRRPALVHALWLLVIVKLLTPPIYELPLLPAAPPESAGPQEVAGAAASPSSFLPGPPESDARFPIPLSTVLGFAWAAGSLGILALGVARALRFRSLVRRADPADAALRREAARWAERLGLRRVPDVRTVDARIPPLVFAFGRAPVVLFPSRLLALVDGERRAALLIHELAHLRRRDHLVRYLEAAATVLFFWNPVAWWARRELRRAEEECCDAWVVWAIPGGSEAYARAIVDTLDFVSETGALVPAFGSGLRPVDSLKRRLTMILTERTPKSLPPFLRAALVLGAALALPPIVGYAQAGSPASDTPPSAATATGAGEIGADAATAGRAAPAGLGYMGTTAPNSGAPAVATGPGGGALGYAGGGRGRRADAAPDEPVRRRGAPKAEGAGTLRRARSGGGVAAPSEQPGPWRIPPPPPPSPTDPFAENPPPRPRAASPSDPDSMASTSPLGDGPSIGRSGRRAVNRSSGPRGASSGGFPGRSGSSATAPEAAPQPNADRIRALEDEMRQLADRLDDVRREIESLKSSSSGEKRPRSTAVR